jgi:hypothetical protein
MAEYRKSSHGEAFPLEELVDLQIQQWSSSNLREELRHALNRPPFNAGAPAPSRSTLLHGAPREKVAERVHPELAELVAREAPSPEAQLRQAFSDFLADSDWLCERCRVPVEPATLRVPPPIEGTFHLYCSEACAA